MILVSNALEADRAIAKGHEDIRIVDGLDVPCRKATKGEELVLRSWQEGRTTDENARDRVLAPRCADGTEWKTELTTEGRGALAALTGVVTLIKASDPNRPGFGFCMDTVEMGWDTEKRGEVGAPPAGMLAQFVDCWNYRVVQRMVSGYFDNPDYSMCS